MTDPVVEKQVAEVAAWEQEKIRRAQEKRARKQRRAQELQANRPGREDG